MRAFGFAAGVALDRLLGANLRDTIEVFPEAIEEVPLVDPDPEPSPARPSFAALGVLASDPRSAPPTGSPEKLEVASVDPERWSAVWAARRDSSKARIVAVTGERPRARQPLS